MRITNFWRTKSRNEILENRCLQSSRASRKWEFCYHFCRSESVQVVSSGKKCAAASDVVAQSSFHHNNRRNILDKIYARYQG